VELDSYLARLGYIGTREPSLATLQQLHALHLRTIPFENLDIHLGTPIVLSLPSLFDKIVLRRRGGFCYELNALFGCLLEQLGYEVDLLSARVFSAGRPGPEHDHMLLLVRTETLMIADVGFGDSFVYPLGMDGAVQEGTYGQAYRLVSEGEYKVLQKMRDGIWHPEYVFAEVPRQLSDFAAMCEYQQTSPASHFTQKSICSRATRNGRVSLSNGSLIVTEAGQRSTRDLSGTAEYRAVLKQYFEIDLGRDAPVHRLVDPGSGAI